METIKLFLIDLGLYCWESTRITGLFVLGLLFPVIVCGVLLKWLGVLMEKRLMEQGFKDLDKDNAELKRANEVQAVDFNDDKALAQKIADYWLTDPEMAQKLTDVIFRRTELGTAGYPGDACLKTCAEIMAAELGWNEQRTLNELGETRDAYFRLGCVPWIPMSTVSVSS